MVTALDSRLLAASLRDDFPILSEMGRGGHSLVYLDNAATTQRPKPVIDALVQTYEHSYANVHRGIHWLSDQATDLYEEAHEAVRQFIRASSGQEIIFTSGTTMAINLVARSWGDANVKAGDEIILTEMEHHSNLVPWHQLSERTGCRMVTWPIQDDGTLSLERLGTLLNEKTRLVSVTAVSNVLGTINPVSDIVSMVHDAGALVLVDAAQSVPHEQTDVGAWQADFVAFSGHKMLGPSGVGVLYGKASVLDAMPPFLGGGSMIRRVRMDGFEPAELPAKFEAGTPPIVSAIGLKVAIEYLQQLGMSAIFQHERALTEYAQTQLSELGDVTILGPACSQKGGIVSFVVQGIHAHDVAQLLDREGIAIRAGHHCAMPLHKRLGIQASNRASFYFYNTPHEVDRLVAAIQSAKKTLRKSR